MVIIVDTSLYLSTFFQFKIQLNKAHKSKVILLKMKKLHVKSFFVEIIVPVTHQNVLSK